MNSNKDINRIRELAKQTIEFSHSELNKERRELWTAIKDLRQIRPVVKIEVNPIKNFVCMDELECNHSFYRDIEYQLKKNLRHATEVGDDYVLEDTYNIGLDIESSSYGVELIEKRIQNSDIAFGYNHPIDVPQKTDLLKPRTHTVNLEKTKQRRDQISDILGDILPVKIFDSLYVPCLTSDLFKLIGNDNMMFWVYDEPEAMHKLMRYMADDKISLYNKLEREGLIFNNTKGNFVGSGSPGYISDGPRGDRAEMKNVWVWLESQETTMISPELFREFFLPYIAEFGKMFGLVYYGCCESHDNKWEDIYKAIPNIRAVSVSPWTNIAVLAEQVQNQVVLSKKPASQFISGDISDWDSVNKELDTVFAAARASNSNLEIIFRDLYTVNGDNEKLKKWVQIAKSKM